MEASAQGGAWLFSNGSVRNEVSEDCCASCGDNDSD
jgi:hypothetical protein